MPGNVYLVTKDYDYDDVLVNTKPLLLTCTRNFFIWPLLVYVLRIPSPGHKKSPHKGCFEMTILQPFLLIFFLYVHMLIFHKTEAQTVILRCLLGLNSNFSKSYDTKCKYFHFPFFRFCKKKLICVFFVFFCFVW